MKRMNILSIALLVMSAAMIAVPVRSVNTQVPNVHVPGGLQVMPVTPLVAAPIQSAGVSAPQLGAVMQPSITQVTNPQPVAVVTPGVQVAVQPVSDQVFLQNTMNKLLGDKIQGLRQKVEKYKKIIREHAAVLEQKLKALFA